MNTNPKQDERTEYFPIYVTKEEKRQLEDMKDNKAIQLEIIKTIFQGEKNWLQAEMSQMDDELLKYKAMLLNCRQAYGEANDLHQTKLNEFWESIYATLPKFTENVKAITNQLEPITTAVKQIDANLTGLSTWRIKDLLEMVNLIDAMSTEKVAMFNMLVENFKTPQS